MPFAPKAKPLHAALARKCATAEELAARVRRQPGSLKEVFDGLQADTARVKYGSLKVLRILSEQEPNLLYPQIQRFFHLLGSENTILKWGAIIIVGNLAAVDSEGRIDLILDRYLEPISGPVMITAANVIGGAAKIAQAKPHLADRIARAFFSVETAAYQTMECRNVALGHAITALDQCFEHLNEPQAVVAFIRRQLHNQRPAARTKAAGFLKRHGQTRPPTPLLQPARPS
jgi:hypothetical protein